MNSDELSRRDSKKLKMDLDVFEQDSFEALDIETPLCSASEKKGKGMDELSPLHGNSEVAIVVNCSADTLMLERAANKDPIIPILYSSTSWTPSINHNETMVPVFFEEPIRLLPHGHVGKPKRFFRTFWRGLAMRAVALQDLSRLMID